MDGSEGYMAGVLSSSKGPSGIASQYATTEGTFCPLPSGQSAGRKNKRQRGMDSMTPDFESSVGSQSFEEDQLEEGLRHHFRKQRRLNAKIELLRKKELLKDAIITVQQKLNRI